MPGSVYSSTDASGNTVTVDFTSGTNPYRVFGGLSDSVAVTGNTVNFKNGTLTNSLYGGYDDAATSSAGAANNAVNLSGGVVTNFVYGAYSAKGDVQNNHVTISNSADIGSNIRGGMSYDNGSAVGNSVTMSGGTARANIMGGASDSNTSDGSGGAIGNWVILSGGSVKKSIYGGYEYATNGKGIALNNAVTISGGTTDGYVTGGYSESGDSTGNAVTLSGTGVVGNNILGGWSASGIVKNNVVTISGGTAEVYVTGGMSNSGDVIGNEVKLSGTGVVKNNILGGQSTNGKTENNTVTISGGTAQGYVTGGYSNGGDSTGNTVTLSGTGIVEKNIIAGISSSGKAEKNTVTIGDNTLVGGAVIGGQGFSANGNTVTISHASVGEYVYGGYSESGDVTNNHVTMTASLVGASGLSALVIGGVSHNGNADGNSVTMTGGKASTSILGGESNNGNATNNSVTMTGGTALMDVFGAVGQKNGNVSGNRVTISDSFVSGLVYGGMHYKENGNVSDNSVTISGGRVDKTVFGGFNDSQADGNTTGNSVTITAGQVTEGVNGGYSFTGDATSNRVTLSDSASVNGDIYGGSSNTGSATDNHISISGGTIKATVYGGYVAQGTGSATGNTISLSGTIDLTTAALYGGSTQAVGGTSGDLFTGNTLNVNSFSGRLQGVQNFENYHFVLPASLSAGQAVLTITGATATDLTNTKIAINGVGSGKALQKGETITLISKTTGAPTSFTAKGVRQGVSMLYDFGLSPTSGVLQASVSGVQINPQTKALSEAQVAGVSFVNAGADFAADAGMASLLSGAASRASNTSENTGSAENTGSSGSAASSATNFGFGAVGGSSVRTETGSHVKVNGASLMVGTGISRELAIGKLTLGGFFETGKGNLNTYNSFAAGDVKGNGETRYTGMGALAHLLTPSGLYSEGSLRVGQVKNEFDSDLKDAAGQSARYDTKAIYAGLHLGLGKVLAMTEASTLDVYGNYFFTHQGGDEATVAGDKFSFDAVTSHRLRTGARYNYALTEAATLYTGGAYEYEFDGKAKASVYGMALDAPELKGGSGILELGATVRPSKTVPLTLNFGLQGYVGQREGISGQASLKYAF